jgi:hypothetical protein
MDYEYHPLANIFPLLTGDDLTELASDIKQHGLRHAIMLFEGKILDGRNRFRACLMVGTTPSFETFEGDWSAARAFVVSENLTRRHLSTSQKAMVAARLAQLTPGGSRSARPGIPSATELADQMAISRASVQAGKRVLKTGTPELVDAVDRGAVKLFRAGVLAKLPAEQQRQVLDGEADPPSRSELPTNIQDRFDECVRILDAYARVRATSESTCIIDELSALGEVRAALDRATKALMRT